MTREFRESPVVQGVDEEIVYTLTTTEWGSSPSSASIKVFDVTSTPRTDVTSTVMPSGSASIAGDVITFPILKSLVIGHVYRIEVKFNAVGNVFEAWGEVRAEE